MNNIMSRYAIRCYYDQMITIIIMYECVANFSRMYEPESWEYLESTFRELYSPKIGYRKARVDRSNTFVYNSYICSFF